MPVDANVSEKHTVCIFRAEENVSIYRRVYTLPKPRTTASAI
jgi:hypothetical protein